jgi:carboxyl-terminal processing protease
MSSRTVKVLLGLFLGSMLLLVVFSAGLGAGLALPNFLGRERQAALPPAEIQSPNIAPQTGGTAQPPEDAEQLFAPFWEAWDIIHRDYVDQPVDDVALMRGAIRGMMDALGDPHSSYMDPDEYLQANLPLDGEYEGIGAWVDSEGELLTIISAMPGSPAERAGLQPGDQVVAVDGEDVTSLDGSLVIRRVLGPAGTSVELTIRREGDVDPLVVSIVRERITLPSVEGQMLEGGIGYVRLYTFAGQTGDDLRGELQSLLDEDPIGLILDLRGNGGGFLTTAVEVASQFIPEGTVLTERFGDGREQVYEAQRGGVATEIPLVVLIDGGTASASEIVAGAIQDHGRGALVGETSFGKGSVQNWVPLDTDEGAVRVTIARWYTPNDRQIHGVGLEPDYPVAAAETPTTLEEDPQLAKAVEVLLAGVPLQ